MDLKIVTLRKGQLLPIGMTFWKWRVVYNDGHIEYLDDIPGYNVENYFDENGLYIGRDCYGFEPMFGSKK